MVQILWASWHLYPLYLFIHGALLIWEEGLGWFWESQVGRVPERPGFIEFSYSFNSLIAACGFVYSVTVSSHVLTATELVTVSWLYSNWPITQLHIMYFTSSMASQKIFTLWLHFIQMSVPMYVFWIVDYGFFSVTVSEAKYWLMSVFASWKKILTKAHLVKISDKGCCDIWRWWVKYLVLLQCKGCTFLLNVKISQNTLQGVLIKHESTNRLSCCWEFTPALCA